MSATDVYDCGFDEDDGKTISANTCEECGGQLRTDGGETACVECGVIVEEYWINHAATTTDYPDDETSEKQTGSPLSEAFHDKGLSTTIGYQRDGNGNTLSGEKRRTLSRLRCFHSQARCRSQAERGLVEAFGEIARLVSALELPYSVREQACVYYRRAQHEGLLIGRSMEALAAGSVYAACRCDRCTRTVEEVAGAARCNTQKVQFGYQILNVELGLAAKPPRPAEFVPQIASAFDVPGDIQYRALQVVCEATKKNLFGGCKPAGVAAACLYHAARAVNWRLTQTDVAEQAHTSSMTIRAHYRTLQEELV